MSPTDSVAHLGIGAAADGLVPPHDLLAEQSTLGGMLLSATVVDEVADIISSADFYVPKHEVIYAAIVALHLRREPTDVIAVTNELLRTGELAKIGDATYLHTLAATPPTYANAGFYASIVAEKGIMRRLREAGMRITQMGQASEGNPMELVADALAAIDAVIGTAKTSVRMVRDILPELLAALEANTTFVPTPWPTLNRCIGGLRPGAVYVIAARPGIGKTVVAAQIAAALADYGYVAFSSLEMSGPELVARLMSERLQIRVGKLKDNKMTPRDWDVFAEGKQKLLDLNIAIDDRASISAMEVRAHAAAVGREGKLVGVVVDYMQLMSSGSKLDRHLQVAEFSRQLKVMAKDLNVPVIALSQLNRKSEERMDREPRLSDLRESGAIEQDADVVILLRREGDYPQEHLLMDVAKNRHGETGEIDLAWQGEFSRAVEWDGPPAPSWTTN